MKVYCGKCRSYTESNPIDYGSCCLNPKHISYIDNSMRGRMVYGDDSKLNKNNDCQDFTPKINPFTKILNEFILYVGMISKIPIVNLYVKRRRK